STANRRQNRPGRDRHTRQRPVKVVVALSQPRACEPTGKASITIFPLLPQPAPQAPWLRQQRERGLGSSSDHWFTPAVG
ncbi:MAG: hypothetical protein L0338_28020, partial [Acidobacteria bacterium]|nr:hypothetical protein [Acidobacteriota bacterium]